MEKKKFTYRYNGDIEPLLEKGSKLYKREARTVKFSLNQLIDICIQKAVVDLPEEINVLKLNVRDQRKEISQLTQDNAKLQSELLKIKEVIKMKISIDKELGNIVS